MKKRLLISLAACVATSAQAASINYTGGQVNADVLGDIPWVNYLGHATTMYEDVLVGSASASSQSGFSTFDSTYDISLLHWTFTSLELQAVGEGDSVTQSPGAATPGYEDYRYTLGATNVNFYYGEDETTIWLLATLTQLVVTVDNIDSTSATGLGTAVVSEYLGEGEALYNEIMALTGGTGELSFTVTNFVPVDDAGTFTSDGSITTVNSVPEPATWAMLCGLAALGLVVARRRG